MLMFYYRYVHIIQTQTTFYLLIYRIRFYAYSFITFQKSNRVILIKR